MKRKKLNAGQIIFRGILIIVAGCYFFALADWAAGECITYQYAGRLEKCDAWRGSDRSFKYRGVCPDKIKQQLKDNCDPSKQVGIKGLVDNCPALWNKYGEIECDGRACSIGLVDEKGCWGILRPEDLFWE